MIEIVHDLPVIYKVSVPLPGTALKNLNSYIIKSGEESVIIDTGFNCQMCRDVLMSALDKLGISPEHTNLLVSHLHSDHMGLAEYFDHPGSVIYMGRKEYEYYRMHIHGEYWEIQDELFIKAGMPAWELEESKHENPAIIYAPGREFTARLLEDGDLIKVGDLTFEAVEVTGHTPGQMCFYLKEDKVMFLADHVLFDITPNIVTWPLEDSCLRKYLRNLERIEKYDIEAALPGHRNLGDKTMSSRIKEIRLHHRRRLDQILSVVEETPGLNAYEIAGRLTWSLRGKRWEDAPKQQKWFAMGEAMAHLEYLMEEGEITCSDYRYYQKYDCGYCYSE